MVSWVKYLKGPSATHHLARQLASTFSRSCQFEGLANAARVRALGFEVKAQRGFQVRAGLTFGEVVAFATASALVHVHDVDLSWSGYGLDEIGSVIMRRDLHFQSVIRLPESAFRVSRFV